MLLISFTSIWEQRLKEAEAKYAEVVARRDELSQKGRALDAKVKQLKASPNTHIVSEMSYS